MDRVSQHGTQIFTEIRKVMLEARKNVAQKVNTELLNAYWQIGRIIVEHEQDSEERAAYGKRLLSELSKELTKEFGKGFSVSNLQFMRRFYQEYPIQQTLSVKLSWSHYCELLSISGLQKRSFSEKEAVNSKWSVRELKRQINTSLFERILLSEGKINKETVLALSQKGIKVSKAEDLMKDPYVFEFLGMPENKPMMESDLEEALVKHIENFY